MIRPAYGVRRRAKVEAPEDDGPKSGTFRAPKHHKQPTDARLRPELLAMFLTPMTLAEAREKGPQPRRSIPFWAHAVANADAMGLLYSPGRGPEWRLTEAGVDLVAAWMAARQVAA